MELSTLSCRVVYVPNLAKALVYGNLNKELKLLGSVIRIEADRKSGQVRDPGGCLIWSGPVQVQSRKLLDQDLKSEFKTCSYCILTARTRINMLALDLISRYMMGQIRV